MTCRIALEQLKQDAIARHGDIAEVRKTVALLGRAFALVGLPTVIPTSTTQQQRVESEG